MQKDKNNAQFIHSVLTELYQLKDPPCVSIMDIGCGNGALVDNLLQLGYDAQGCDFQGSLPGNHHFAPDTLKSITSASPKRGNFDSENSAGYAITEKDTYRLPYEDNSINVVVSMSVLEHVDNKRTYFQEIHRILKPEGYSLHLFPSKWYLPYEPHIHIPLLNYFGRRCPYLWIGLWVWIFSVFDFSRKQEANTLAEVTRKHYNYNMKWINYASNQKYRKLSIEIFGNYSSPMEYYINKGDGGVSRLLRKLPFKKITGWLFGEVRYKLIIQRKQNP